MRPSSEPPRSSGKTANIYVPEACDVRGERVRIAVVGGGRMGRTHLQALRLSREAAAVALVDPVPAVRVAASADGLQSYASVDELIAAGGFDAALIAAPSDLHLELVDRLARHGIPILCEKPCGLFPEDAAAAAAAARAGGALLQIGYWRRFVPELGALRERASTGSLGEITLVVCHQWDSTPPPQTFRAHSGGIAVDMGVHEIDQVRWLLGQEFEALAAMPAGRSPAGVGLEDPDSLV